MTIEQKIRAAEAQDRVNVLFLNRNKCSFLEFAQSIALIADLAAQEDEDVLWSRDQ